jgi:flagellar hook-associated protein 2
MSTGATASFSGLSSGLQWADTVDSLMQIESQPLYRLESRKNEEQTRIDAWVSITSKLNALSIASEAINTANKLLAMKASSTDSDLITVSANSNAIAATHSIEVNQLAQQEVEVHDGGWADLNQTSLTTAGTDFSYTYDGETRTLTLPAGSTLADLIEAINDDEDNPGVSASSIDDGTATDPYHLVLTANEAASASSIAINDGATTIGLTGSDFDSATWTETKSAQQSQIRVDGYPPADWIYRDSNTIEDVIDGVTLNIKDVTASDVQITVTEDQTETKAAIDEFISAYNDLIVELEAKTRYDTVSETRGLLSGDSTVRSLKSDIMSISAGEVPGVASNAAYKTLGSVGIDLTSGGKLKVDSSDLTDALEADAQAVADLFTLDTGTDNNYITFFKQESETVGGEYEVTINYLANGNIDPAANNTIGGFPATIESGHILVGKEGTAVEGLRVYFDGPGGGAGTETAMIRVGKGVASQFESFYDIASDSVDGLIKQAKDVYEDSIENLDKQIENFERRLVIKRDILTRQFLAMEQAVSNAQAQAGWIS